MKPSYEVCVRPVSKIHVRWRSLLAASREVSEALMSMDASNNRLADARLGEENARRAYLAAVAESEV